MSKMLTKFNYPLPPKPATNHDEARAYFKWAGLFPGGGLNPEDDARDIMTGDQYVFTMEEADLVEEAREAAWEHFEGDPFELPEYDIDFVLANS